MEILSHLRTVSEPEWLGDRYGGGTKETEEGAEVGRSGFTSCLPLMTQCSAAAAAAAKSLQSCPTLCDPTDGSPPGSPVPGILQARTLEWVAISFSNARK